jgi:quercetin dioxygenase-like cupin family protein
MKAFHRMMLFICAALVAATGAIADTATKGGFTITPADMQWKPSARVPGLETVDFIGSGAGNQPGTYTYRVKFPANFKMQAHSHPDERHYTILSGTWYVGFGDKADPARMKALPPGSFYVEPANVPHFVATRDEGAVIQISGTGPTAVNYVDPAHAPPKK